VREEHVQMALQAWQDFELRLTAVRRRRYRAARALVVGGGAA
jgi:hypothetical protein